MHESNREFHFFVVSLYDSVSRTIVLIFGLYFGYCRIFWLALLNPVVKLVLILRESPHNIEILVPDNNFFKLLVIVIDFDQVSSLEEIAELEKEDNKAFL